MPVYDYDCAACGRRFEVTHGVHADGPTTCALCGKGPVRKAFSAPAIHFRGSGWAKKERRAAVGAGAKSGSDSAGEGASDGTGGDGASGGDHADGKKDAAKKDAGSKRDGTRGPAKASKSGATSEGD
jgi:putative FmdB family regulatory protein